MLGFLLSKLLLPKRWLLAFTYLHYIALTGIEIMLLCPCGNAKKNVSVLGFLVAALLWSSLLRTLLSAVLLWFLQV